MIEIRTGLPGHGKTLSFVQELAALYQRWEKHGEEARPVFTNIKGLALPHSPIPIAKVITSKEGTETYIPDWDLMPDGSLVCFDEAQDFFPPRSSQSTPPPYVAWLNTHRHKGFDLVFVTQQPKLIDGNVRALCGKHKHYRRTFGWGKSIIYEWDGCSDSLSGMKNATTTLWNHPKKAFEWYKSAEIHTKQKFRLPLWLGIPFVGVALGLFFVPRAYSVLNYGMTGKSLHASTQAATLPASPAATVQAGGAIAPTAPALKGADTVLAQAAPVEFAGCIANDSRCMCLTHDGALVDAPELCQISARSGSGRVRISMNYPAATYVPESAKVVPELKRKAN